MINKTNLGYLVGAATLVASCSPYPLKKVIDAHHAQLTEETAKDAASVGTLGSGHDPVLEVNKGVWLGGKSVPLSSDAQLAPVFNDVTLRFPGRMSISTLAERLTKVTGLAVNVSPDVFLPASQLIPGGQNLTQQPGQQGGAPRVATPALTQPQLSQSASSVVTSNYSSDVEMNYSGSLSGALDLASGRLGISWEYRDGTIHLFRLVTRSFFVKANPGSSNFDAQIGKTGTQQAGSQGGTQSSQTGTFNSTANIQLQSHFSVWEGIDAAMKAMLSPIGKYAVSQATGTVTVTDTKEVVERVAQYIENENRILSRQVAIRVEVLDVTTTDANDFGIDMNLVFSKLSNLVPAYKLAFATPASLVATAAGNLGIQIVEPVTSDIGITTQLSGSQAFFRALSTVAKTSVVTRASALTMNRQPVPVAITSQVGYLAQTTPAIATTGGTGGVPGLTPGTVTTGFIMNFLPTITDSNSVILQFSIDSSTLVKLDTISSGIGASLQSIQTPNINGMEFLQRLALKPGSTLVLTGFERHAGQYDQRTAAPNLEPGLAGSISATKTMQTTVILVTPVIAEGV
jgi:type IVB pilus formation R64 PilN family outer membrane protein